MQRGLYSRKPKRTKILTDNEIGTLGDLELADELAVAADHGLAEGDDAVSGGGAHDLRERGIEAEQLADKLVEVRERVEVVTGDCQFM
jgi:hypothetical protein